MMAFMQILSLNFLGYNARAMKRVLSLSHPEAHTVLGLMVKEVGVPACRVLPFQSMAKDHKEKGCSSRHAECQEGHRTEELGGRNGP